MDATYMRHCWRVHKQKEMQTARRRCALEMLTDVWYMLTYEQPFLA